MKIPKYVELLISDIENFGKQLENREAKLYKWLEANQIDSNILDEELNNLIQFHNGHQLKNYIKNKEK